MNWEATTDYAIYHHQLSKWSRLDFSDNTIRGVNYLADHQSFSLILLSLLYWTFIPHPLIWATPFLLIFIPTFIFDKCIQEISGKKTSLLLLIAIFSFLSINPYTQNGIITGFHGMYVESVLYPLLLLFFIKAIR